MKLLEKGDITHPGYKNRSIVKGKGGHQNIRIIKDKVYLIIGTINYGEVDIGTPEKLASVLAWRDDIRARQLLPKASY